MRSIQVLRHGHVNQFARNYDHVLNFYRTVFDADVFLEFEEPDFGGKNAVYVAGAACFELFAPTNPDMAIGASIARFGERWHSLEWTVPNLDEAIDIVTERGIRITDRSPGNYIFVHPRDCHGLCLELTTHFFNNDPRDAVDFDSVKGVNSNPLALTGGPIITMVSSDAQESIAWVADFTGRTPDSTHQGTRANAHAINFGDHVIEYVTPNQSESDKELHTQITTHGASMFSVTLPVRDLDHAQRELERHNLAVAIVPSAPVPLLALDLKQTDGARLQFMQA